MTHNLRVHLRKSNMHDSDEILNRDIKTVVRKLNENAGSLLKLGDSDAFGVRDPTLTPPHQDKKQKPIQKYKVVAGKVYEAVQLKEHQFSNDQISLHPDQSNLNALKPSQQAAKIATSERQPSLSYLNP